MSALSDASCGRYRQIWLLREQLAADQHQSRTTIQATAARWGKQLTRCKACHAASTDPHTPATLLTKGPAGLLAYQVNKPLNVDEGDKRAAQHTHLWGCLVRCVPRQHALKAPGCRGKSSWWRAQPHCQCPPPGGSSRSPARLEGCAWGSWWRKYGQKTVPVAAVCVVVVRRCRRDLVGVPAGLQGPLPEHPASRGLYGLRDGIEKLMKHGIESQSLVASTNLT